MQTPARGGRYEFIAKMRDDGESTQTIAFNRDFC